VVYKSRKNLIYNAAADTRDATGKRRDKGKDKDTDKSNSFTATMLELEQAEGMRGPDAEGVTVLDSPTDSQEEQDLKRIGLQLMNAIADVHERVKKWRISRLILTSSRD
jgi:hypothetical protein